MIVSTLVMKPVLQECPQDHAKLIYLASGPFASGVAGWTLYYCPNCDSPITVIDNTAPDDSPESMICWKRISQDSFEPRQGVCIPRSHEEAFAELRSRIPSDVSRWLARRHTEPSVCPKDGARIPRLTVLTHSGENTVVYLWCPWCRLGFACMHDPVYGWQYHAAFERELSSYTLTKEYQVGGGQRYHRDWLRELCVDPPRDLLDSR